MTKVIAIFIDGTGNLGQENSAINTNVYKLWQKVDPSQLSMYVEGIGTDPSPVGATPLGRLLAWTQGKYAQLLGVGASDRVRKAYEFLALNYQTNDQIFLFGFSRGAFIARMLAGFIHRVGLLFAHHATSEKLEEAFALYCADERGEQFEAYVQKVESDVNGRAEGIFTHFLGQWDTVETLDFFGKTDSREALLREVAARDRHHPLPPWIRTACHALAIHEARQPYEPTIWLGVTDDNTQRLQQVWFAGDHSDVGGGHPSDDGAGSRYSDIALQWMWDEAENAGLAMSTSPHWDAPNPLDVPHVPPAWKFGGLPARVRPALANMNQRNAGFEFIHCSALKRLATPIEKAYDQVEAFLPTVWKKSDAISMQAHFEQCFGPTSVADLTPEQLVLQENQFFNFLDGKATLPGYDTELALKLLLIFLREPTVSLTRSDYDQASMHSVFDAVKKLRGALRVHDKPCAALTTRHAAWNAWIEALYLDFSLDAQRPIPNKLIKKTKI